MSSTVNPSPSQRWTILAFLAALVTVVGSLSLTIILGLKACPLCLYQRSFAMGAFAMLLMGLLTGQRGGLLSLLALPLAVGGVGVAVMHVYLELNGTLECPSGIAGLGSAPQQSLLGLAILTVFLIVDVYTAKEESEGMPLKSAGIVSIILGVALTLGCMKSAPPLPKPPTSPYDAEKQPLLGCRPPFVKAEQ